ncbi:hypothetical protein NDU88_007556 [Pleurodeles waltl]|uniref:Uncharacterized protein n=1 Tax=Pleurodeles waltl TaxID=8319 RepID=A0AAV7QPH0_PLEWA|nr:hypothetical protein NDU88_007556 [Pleurodeles waltl]
MRAAWRGFRFSLQKYTNTLSPWQPERWCMMAREVVERNNAAVETGTRRRWYLRGRALEECMSYNGKSVFPRDWMVLHQLV